MDIQIEEIQRRIGALLMHVWALEAENAALNAERQKGEDDAESGGQALPVHEGGPEGGDVREQADW